MKLKYNFIVQKIGDGYAAVTYGKDVDSFSGMIRLNETAKSIFECLKEETSIDEIVEKMLAEYDTDEKTMRNSVETVINQFNESGII